MVKAKKKAPTNSTVKLGVLVSPDFQMAFSSLINANLTIKGHWQVMKVADSVTAHQKRYEDLRQGLLKKYGQKDEQGQLAMNADKTSYLIADRAGFDLEFRDLLDLEVEVAKIPMSCVEEVKLNHGTVQLLVKTVLQPDA